MPLSENQRKEITDLLQKKIENKLKRYARESLSMPFLARLIQDSEKVAAYSFIHSIATTLGMSIYEDVSLIIAREHCEECFKKYGIGGVLSKDQKSVIKEITRGLRNGERRANIAEETCASSAGGKYHKEGNEVDFCMSRNGVEHYFEIKTVKPNIDVFAKSKEKMLEWIARRRKPVKVYLAFPYNPYHPEPYSRFTMQNMMDHPKDFLVGEEYWDFLGGKNTLKELLDVFDFVGKQYKEHIQRKIKLVAKDRIESY